MYKHSKQIACGIQILKIIGVIVTIIGAVSGCASTDSGSAWSDANDQAQYWMLASTNCHTAQTVPDSGACITAIKILQRASQTKVEFTSDEIGQLATFLDGDTDRVKDLVDQCNDASYVDEIDGQPWGDAARSCGFLAEWAMGTPGMGSAKVELVYQRACALPRVQNLVKAATSTGFSTEYGNFCAELGDLYRKRGDMRHALAVYQYAPNCHASGFEPDHPNLFDTACSFGADEILEVNAANALKLCTQTGQSCSPAAIERVKRDYANVEADFHQLCTRHFADAGGPPIVCDTHLSGAEQAAAERDATRASELRHEQAEQEYEQRQANERAHDAEVDDLVNAIRSLPGGSDPNAIVATANQEAGQMIAVGAANDAARTPAAAERNAPQREEVPVPRPDAQPAGSPSSGSGVTYAQPAMNCLAYTAAGQYEGVGVWATNSCSYEIEMTWATPSAPATGNTILNAGERIFVPAQPVKVFACTVIKGNGLSGNRSMGIYKTYDAATNQSTPPTYDDPRFVCPVYPVAP